MTDYLGSLINRARAAEGEVRPRLGSVFEPARGIGRSLPDVAGPPLQLAWNGGDLAAEQARDPEAPSGDELDQAGLAAPPARRRRQAEGPAGVQERLESLGRTISVSAAYLHPMAGAASGREISLELEARRGKKSSGAAASPDVRRRAAEAGGFAQTGGNQANQGAGGFHSSSLRDFVAQTGGNQENQGNQGNQRAGGVAQTGESQEVGRETVRTRSVGWQADAGREALWSGLLPAPTTIHPATTAGQSSASPGTDTPGEGARSQLDPALGRRREPDEERPSLGPVARQVVEPHVALAPRAPAQPHLPAARSAEPPAIKVTIGRIEVRAVQPVQQPAPARPPSRPRPALSLDDYLKQRGEGR